MTAREYRAQLEQTRRRQADAERRAASLRQREATARASATQQRSSAARTHSAGIRDSRLRSAARREKEANKAARDAASWEARGARLGRRAAALDVLWAEADAEEREAVEAVLRHERREAMLRITSEQTRLDTRLTLTEGKMNDVIRHLRAPRPEPLRVLMLGAAAGGDLRIPREQARIRAAVERALHRDLVELDAHPAATADHLLDGLTRFRPHVVHFSGHSASDLVVFEQDTDRFHDGAVVSARAFARAIAAVDEQPLLVLLNSCDSAPQAARLVDTVPLAIGMSASIGDIDAITYAARFYAAVADGQSIRSAHAQGRVAIEMAGLLDHDLPTLFHADDVDPSTALLVSPPPTAPPPLPTSTDDNSEPVAGP
ncbi:MULTISPECIES: hypothetical protein [unclassified Streptomyces]|uniref:hypothetical protein n=1 Tax=unclassified Streptomyces TaxID=2593676 RepID=UPI0035DC55E9